MDLISFYPGPSQLRDGIGDYLTQGLKSGILSANHRSRPFMQMAEETIASLKRKMQIPDSYHVFFAGSATECWEVLSQSLPQHRSHHFHSGAFGNRWYERAANIKGISLTRQYPYAIHDLPPTGDVELSPDGLDLICFTHNETSNGTHVPLKSIRKAKTDMPNTLLAVDATSSMAGVWLDWELADFWYASVQKCFGLPAGLSVLVCSPRGAEAAHEHDPKLHYNSLAVSIEQMKKYQTPYTPNVTGIYLLGRVMQASLGVMEQDTKTKERARSTTQNLQDMGYSLLSDNLTSRSSTVLAVRATESKLKALFDQAPNHGLVIGKGYSPWKESTFRLANFPAVPDEGFERLWSLLHEVA